MGVPRCVASWRRHEDYGDRYGPGRRRGTANLSLHPRKGLKSLLAARTCAGPGPEVSPPVDTLRDGCGWESQRPEGTRRSRQGPKREDDLIVASFDDECLLARHRMTFEGPVREPHSICLAHHSDDPGGLAYDDWSDPDTDPIVGTQLRDRAGPLSGRNREACSCLDRPHEHIASGRFE